MPSFNQARYLEEAIRSVVSQDYPRLEFMILDGGSTDGSREIIKRYGDRIDYWESGPDHGQTEALVRGFERATGDLLGWVNSDDMLLPGALWKVAIGYLTNPSAGLISGNHLLIDAGSRITRFKRHPAEAPFWSRRGLMTVTQPGSFFRKDIYRAAGGLRQDLQYVMDTELYLRMLGRPDVKYIHLSDWISAFRKHENAKTVAYRYLARREHRAALGSGHRKHAWAIVYRIWQVVNGNYLRMAIGTLAYWRAPVARWVELHGRLVHPPGPTLPEHELGRTPR